MGFPSNNVLYNIIPYLIRTIFYDKIMESGVCVQPALGAARGLNMICNAYIKVLCDKYFDLANKLKIRQ